MPAECLQVLLLISEPILGETWVRTHSPSPRMVSGHQCGASSFVSCQQRVWLAVVPCLPEIRDGIFRTEIWRVGTPIAFDLEKGQGQNNTKHITKYGQGQGPFEPSKQTERI